ncbi:MAG: methyltransferase [Mariprofundaceae bacterium]
MNHRQPEISIWHRQFLHLLSVATLLVLAWSVWAYLGKPQPLAFWTAIVFPIIHQVFVWLSWRLELRASLTSHWIGFRMYVVIFFILFGGRFISLSILAWLDHGSLGLGMPAQAIMVSLCLLPGMYAMYSVVRYFGMARASGADHFDPKYRTMPLVKEGIFRFTDNAMYMYAFLLFWAIAMGFNSASAMIVAAFSHVYIWVHFYCTEKPDMDFIYGSESNESVH